MERATVLQLSLSCVGKEDDERPKAISVIKLIVIVGGKLGSGEQ